jgi:recombination protein RecA
VAAPKRERPRLLSEIETVQLPVIPTGNWAIDYGCLGIGGFPRGRISEVYGAESGGKTTLVLQVCAQANKMGLKALFIDAEHSIEPDRAIQLGCSPELFAVYQPDSAEDAIDTLYEECKLGEYAVIVVDSTAALTPMAELEKSAADLTVGAQARLLSTGLRKVIGAADLSKTCVLMVNQLRQKIGISFGNPNTTPGGNALKFYSSVRVEVTRIGTNKEKDVPVSNRVKIKAVKNKLAPPYRQVEVDLIFALGYDNKSTIFDAAMEAGIIKRSGAWFSMGDRKLGQGRQTAIDSLTDDDIAKLTEKLK